MKHYKEREVPARIEKFVAETTCDLCRETIKLKNWHLDDVDVRRRVGSNYPEGGNGTETVFDICGKCFETKLVPWLVSQGAKPDHSEWDC